MTRDLAHRGLWLAATVSIIFVLSWLDHHRGGPASTLSRCNLLLSRNESPAADVLIVGSSRSGVALDPVAMQEMLAYSFPDSSPTVERIALGENPLRSSHALLENYLEARGAPRVIALEIMFMNPRSVDRLAKRGFDLPPEHYVFRRDLNLLTFSQILRLPSVAMPYTEGEGMLTLWRFRMRGVVLRAGALVYQFFRHPAEAWDLSTCDRSSWTREPEWPPEFSFSYGSFTPGAPPGEVIEATEAVMMDMATKRGLKPWQTGVPEGQRYPYDFADSYRQGEVVLLKSMLELAARHGAPVVLLPMPLYGYTPGDNDLHALAGMLPAQTQIFDLYGQVRGKLDKFWYDDGHIELYPAGALTSAILAQHLLDTGLLSTGAAETRDD